MKNKKETFNAKDLCDLIEVLVWLGIVGYIAYQIFFG